MFKDHDLTDPRKLAGVLIFTMKIFPLLLGWWIHSFTELKFSTYIALCNLMSHAMMPYLYLCQIQLQSLDLYNVKEIISTFFTMKTNQFSR